LSVQSGTGSAQRAEKVVLDFAENQLLGALFGQHDENLARIEQLLDVSIASRGNRLAIEGPSAACQLAGKALNNLYQRLREGRAIEHGDVDGAVRMADSNVESTISGKGSVVSIPAKKQTAGGAAHAVVQINTRKRIISPRSPGQAAYMDLLNREKMVFGVGPAGTGKTYLAVAMGVAKLQVGEVDRIILSRPAVEAGENLGFLPGDLKEKVDPYLRPLYDALYDVLPAGQVEKFFESGQIEIAPLAFMRGRTLSDAYVILDEAQNTTAMQMKMFLTRFGANCRMVIAGDPSQTDLPGSAPSGLLHALNILEGIEGISVVHFGAEDVVRHPLVGSIVRAYDAQDGSPAIPEKG
jgi:phosphate starvation-inducible PhoH-like protein